jgi:hypothetical protein
MGAAGLPGTHNPIARFDFHLISNRGKELPPGAEESTSFLKSYIAKFSVREGDI